MEDHEYYEAYIEAYDSVFKVPGQFSDPHDAYNFAEKNFAKEGDEIIVYRFLVERVYLQ